LQVDDVEEDGGVDGRLRVAGIVESCAKNRRILRN
jgi:hypothetical protein